MSAGMSLPGVKKSTHPFRRAVLRGLAMVLPPLLTIVVFVWVWNAIESNVLQPIESRAREVLVLSLWDAKSAVPKDLPLDNSLQIERDGRVTSLAQLFDDKVPEQLQVSDIAARGGKIVAFNYQDRIYRVVTDGNYVPETVINYVAGNPGKLRASTADEIYQRYVQLKYMNRWLVIPIFLCVFVLVLYLLGKFLAAGLGRMLWNVGESIVHRLPIIRSVYSSVKQITDFIFTEQDLAFTRVVALEYPRKGIWSLAFVTGDGMYDIREHCGEPVLSVLVPTSPMPATGFAMIVKKSDTVELDITIDQAIQFIVSCSVVIPPQQMAANRVGKQLAKAVAEHEALGTASTAQTTTL